MKQWELLTGRCGIYCSPLYPVHEDSLRLAEFFHCKPSDRVLDLGTGNGILAIYANALHGGQYTGIDLDESALLLAEESAKKNGQAILFQTCSVEDAPSVFGHGTFDQILMNPPYYTTGKSGRNALARHADQSLLAEWIHASFLLLKNGGSLSLCYPANQLAALFRALDQNRFAPKVSKLLFQDEQARLVLLKAKKLGKDGLIIMYHQD